MTTLTNTTHFPPGGYQYREAINGKIWATTPELAMLGLNEVSRALQIARIQNPLSGLNPNFEACLNDIKQFTCKRLNYDSRYCGEDVPGAAFDSTPTKGKKKKCASCGKRR